MTRLRLILVLSVFCLAACGGAGATTAPRTDALPTSAPTATAPDVTGAGLPSAEELCALLTADDWGAYGYETAAQPTINSDGPGSAYCVFAGESGATGGLELDAFAHDTVEEAEETFDVTLEGMPGAAASTLPGVDAALVATDIESSYAAIVVRNGRFVYTISLPTGDEAQAQLLALAATVLTRSQAWR